MKKSIKAAIDALAVAYGYHIACRSRYWVGDTGSVETIYEWVSVEDLIDQLTNDPGFLEDETTVSIRAISAEDAEAICAAAEDHEPIGREAMPDETSWLVITDKRRVGEVGEHFYPSSLHEYVFPKDGY